MKRQMTVNVVYHDGLYYPFWRGSVPAWLDSGFKRAEKLIEMLEKVVAEINRRADSAGDDTVTELNVNMRFDEPEGFTEALEEWGAGLGIFSEEEAGLLDAA